MRNEIPPPPPRSIDCAPLGVITVRALPRAKIAAALAPLSNDLACAAEGSLLDVNKVLVERPEDVILVIANALDLPREAVGDLPFSKVKELVLAIVEQNFSFIVATMGSAVQGSKDAPDVTN